MLWEESWSIGKYIYQKLSHRDTVFKTELKEKGSFKDDMVNKAKW